MLRAWRQTARRSASAMAFALASLALPGAVGASRAQGLVADLSHDLVAVTTAFSGSDVLLFGTVTEPSHQVIVTVTGPRVRTTVRRKTRVGLAWLNTQAVTFDDVPELYLIAASAPLDTLVPVEELDRLQLGPGRLVLRPASIDGVGDRQVPAFRAALLRRKQAAGLYGGTVGRVSFIGSYLFRTTLSFPANTPPGPYEVRTLELADGRLIGQQSRLLLVSKVGIEAGLFDIAHEQAPLYALSCLLVAVGAGWSAAVIFKRS